MSIIVVLEVLISLPRNSNSKIKGRISLFNTSYYLLEPGIICNCMIVYLEDLLIYKCIFNLFLII